MAIHRHVPVIALLTALALSACQQQQPAAKAPVVNRPHMSPLLSFVSGAAVGQRAQINDPELGLVNITLERQYYSAAGQTCRRFTVWPTTGQQIQAIETGVACLEVKQWTLVRMLPPIN